MLFQIKTLITGRGYRFFFSIEKQHNYCNYYNPLQLLYTIKKNIFDRERDNQLYNKPHCKIELIKC